MKKLLLTLTAIIFFVAPFSVFAHTDSTSSEKVVSLGKNETIEHDYFNAGEKVVIEGTINGDAYIAGGQVEINGTIKGDLLVAGGEVTLHGTVTQNVRAIGGTVMIEGTVGRNVSIAGGTVSIDRSAKISGNAALVGGTISLLSPVKSLNVAGGDVSLQSTVSGDVMGAVGTFQLYSDAKVKGNLTYWSDSQAVVSNGASVSGTVSFNQTNFKNRMNESQEKAQNTANGFRVFAGLISFSSALVVGFLLIRFLPVFSAKTSNYIITHFGRSSLYGFLIIVATPILVVLLLMTLIGSPLAIFILFGYGAVWYLSKFFVTMALGSVFQKATKLELSPYITFTVGMTIFYLLGYLPVIGFIVKLLSLVAGVGALVLTKKELFMSFRSKKLI